MFVLIIAQTIEPQIAMAVALALIYATIKRSSDTWMSLVLAYQAPSIFPIELLLKA